MMTRRFGTSAATWALALTIGGAPALGASPPPAGVPGAVSPAPVVAPSAPPAAPAGPARPPAGLQTPLPAVLPLAAGTVPTVKTLLAAIAQSRGRDLETETRVVTTTGGPVATTSTTYRSGNDDRTLLESGQLHREYGAFHGRRWTGNYNGQVVFRADDTGATDADGPGDDIGYPGDTQRVERAPSSDAFVLVATSRDGEIESTTVDRTSGRITRIETKAGAESDVVTYDDFRTTAGASRAWHWTERDGHADDDRDSRITRLDAGPVDATNLAIPTNRVLVEFPQGTTKVVLPATLHGRVFVVRLNFGNRGLDFILDSGCYDISIDEGVAKGLGLPVLDRISNGANAGRFTSKQTIVPEIAIGPLKMHDVAISTIPNGIDEEAGVFRAVGLLGYDFIAATKLIVSYDDGIVTAFDPKVPLPLPSDAPGFTIPVRLENRTPNVDVAINGVVGKLFTLDTGGAGGLMIFEGYAKKHPEALVDEGRLKGQKLTFIGVGGDFETSAYQLRQVRFGKVNFEHYVAFRVKSGTAYGVEDGLIGQTFLITFDLYFDYPNSQMSFYFNKANRPTTSK